MKTFAHKFLKPAAVITAAATLFVSCNKDLPEATPIVATAPTGSSILEAIRADQTNYSILDSAIKRAGAAAIARLNDRTGRYTFFAPTNSAFATIGVTSVTALAAFRPGQLDTILSYHTVPGVTYRTDSVSQTALNVQLPTAMVLAPPSASLPPGLRNSVFLSRRGTAVWVNNIPVVQPNTMVANGVVHAIGSVLLPPSQFLWNRIDTDPNLTYLRAAVLRADSGVVASSTLQGALLNPAANLTIMAPTNAAFQQLLTGQIYQALRAQGLDSTTSITTATALASTPGVFTNPAVANVLTPTTVRGLVAYHGLGTRAFSVNLPTTTTNFPTLLNGSIPAHPGVAVQATFAGPSVTAISVKGVVNPTAAAVSINPTPAPNGTSDQNYINGVLHVINQVLRPL